MQHDNPAGTEGFAFLEYATHQPEHLAEQWKAMGFTLTSQHQKQPIACYQQGGIFFYLNQTPVSAAHDFASIHKAGVSAMGFKVKNAKKAYEHVLAHGAKPYEGAKLYDYPAIHGIGSTLIYLVDDEGAHYHATHHFKPVGDAHHTGHGLTYIDHVTHNLYRGHMDEWANFYTRLFGFYEVRYFDIEGRVTGLKSRAMTSPCGKIRIPLNESSDDKSQIEEFLHDFNGEGIQHIALGTNDIYDSVEKLKHHHIDFLETPDTYYELIEKRLPNHGEKTDRLKTLSILIDGHTEKERKLLLQIFTKNMIGPVFYEIIQRKGDDGFGEGNFRALFESIELDQIRRGVITLDK